MSLVLYRKYRPKNFSEIIGQEKIVKILSSAITSERVAHAYLFNGPRGTGKTTIARILAKAINCTDRRGAEPCNKCENCVAINSGRTFDIIEIDAASNTGVDNIRELKESIGFSPSHLKYKVFIIDEAHMLSKGAFNALLKTLEEPPAHAIFILATTEIHKIPPTIISRAQRFDFRKMRIDEIVGRLQELVDQEKIKVGKGVLETIALSADGGMRDAESMLGQIITLESAGEEIKLEEVKSVLGMTDTETVMKFVEFLSNNKIKESIIYLNDLTFQGHDLEQFAGSLVDILRRIMILKTNRDLKKYVTSDSTQEQTERLLKLTDSFNEQELLWLFKKIITAKNEIKSSVLPQIPFEITIIEYDFFKNKRISDKKPESAPMAETPKTEPLKTGAVIKKKLKNIEPEEEMMENVSEPEKIVAEKTTEDAGAQITETPDVSAASVKDENLSGLGIEEIKEKWAQILKISKKYNHSIAAFLKLSAPVDLKGAMLTIATPYKFHAEKLNDSANRGIIEKVLAEVFENKGHIKTQVIQDENIKVGAVKEAAAKTGDAKVDSVLDMFGGTVE